MMKNILIPTDFSTSSWNAIAYTLDLFENTPCRFYLLHVNVSASDYFDTPDYNIGTNILVEKKQKLLKQKLNNLLKRIEKLDKSNGHHFFVVHDQNYFINSVRDQVREKKIDLIVIGTKGVTGLKEIIIGSNAGDIITKVKCNTLVVPKNAHYKSLKEVTFASDHTIFYSATILNDISEFLKDHNSTIRVLNVTKSSEKLSEKQSSNKEYLKDYLDETYKGSNSFHTITNKSVTSAIQCFVESRDVNMIIMVAKNLNFIHQTFFDSTVEKVSFHTTVPFLVLHE